MPDTVTVRPYADHDLGGVLELLRAALGETPVLKRTPELFAWKHFNNPFGRSILLVAEAEGTIAGLRAFMRWELMTADGTTLRCVRAVDTATHPEFQRRGLAKALLLKGFHKFALRGSAPINVLQRPVDNEGCAHLAEYGLAGEILC